MDEISLSMIVVTIWETFGWLSVIGAGVAVLLLLLLVIGFVKARAKGLRTGKLLSQGILLMLVVAAILTPFVPLWTLAPAGDLFGLVDYIFAFSMALAPAAIFGVVWFFVGSLRTKPSAAT